MDTWWSPAATRREARLSRCADLPFVVVVADLPAHDRLQRFAKCSALEATTAIDRLYIAARRAQDASGTDVPAAEENLEQAVREALKTSVSHKKIHQITGLGTDRIRTLRPPVVPGPRSRRTAVARPRPAASPPLDWPEWVGENLAAIKRSEGATPRITIISGGLPGQGKRR
jgi:hypothetical protein